MRLTALLLEDQPDHAIIIEGLLKPLDFDVITATKSSEATMLLAQAFPHLLLVDIYLANNENGLDWLLQIRHEKYRDIPVLIITSSKDKQDIQRAVAMGITNYLVKPIDPRIFNKKVETIALQIKSMPLYACQSGPDNPILGNLHLRTQIAAISEMGFEISGSAFNVRVTPNIALESPIYEQIGIQKPASLTALNHYENPPSNPFPHRFFCEAHGWSDEDRKKIRDWITAQMLRRSFDYGQGA